MILLLVLSLILTSIENARVLSAEARGKEISYMALDSCFSSYAREVFDEYGLMVLWKSDNAFMEAYEGYLDKNGNYQKEDPLRPANLFKIEWANTALAGKQTAIDGQGELLEQQIYEYMRYAVADDLAALLQGDVGTLAQSQDVEAVNDKLESCNSALENMEESVGEIYESIEQVKSIEDSPEEVLVAMKHRLEEIMAIPADDDEYNKTVRDNTFHLYRFEFRKYYEWQKTAREAFDNMLSGTQAYYQNMGTAQSEAEKAKQELDSRKEALSEELFDVLEGEINDLYTQVLRIDTDSYGVVKNEETAVRQKAIVDQVVWDMSEILEEMWNLDDSDNRLYIYDKDGTFIEKMYQCVCNACRDIQGYSAAALQVQYEKGSSGKTKNEVVEFVKKIKKDGVLSYIATGKISEKKITDKEALPSRQVTGCSESNWTGKAVTEETLRRVLLGQYILDQFGCFLTPGQAGLDYEIEYILAGKWSDRDNLTEIVNKFVLIREGFNLLFLMKDTQKREEAYTLAVTVTGFTGMPVVIRITQLLILGAWAYAESVVDVRDLLAGYRVPVMKNEEEWNLSLTGVKNLSAEGQTEEEKKDRQGLAYEDYLRYLLFAQDRAEQIYRLSDLIQMNMCQKYNEDFRLAECLVGVEVDVDYRIRRLFTSFGFLKRMISNGGSGFEVNLTQKYGY